VLQYGLQGKAVEIIGMSMATDFRSSFEDKSCIKVVGFDMSQAAAREAYRQAGVGPQDVQVIELHGE
jgi:sterol carrier protein 2